MRRLSHYLTLATLAWLLLACSAQKNTSRSRMWQSFTARYNTYFNGHEAFTEGTALKDASNRDDYTAQLPLYAVANPKSRQIGASQFDRTIQKMEKTIKQHSIKARPEWNKNRRKTPRDREWLSRREYNPFLWRAWLLLGKAQFQKGDFDEAAATFAYMSRLYSTQPALNGVARSWLAKCYTQLGWAYEAEDVIRNMSRDSMHYRTVKDWDYTYADYYLATGQLEQAVPYLRKVIAHERRKRQKAREWYIMGQVQAQLGHRQEAIRAFQKVVAQNPPYEMEFHARIAQTEVMATPAPGQPHGAPSATARKMIARLRRMAADDNNKDYLDQVYYAIGNIYIMQDDTLKAIEAYERGNAGATQSGTEKGVLLLQLGNIYWQRQQYADAQRCYGEAIGLLDRDRPGYDQLSERSKVLDELVPHTETIHLQDSLLLLASMTEADRNAAIDRVIEALKKKEKEERQKEQEAAAEAQQQRQGAAGNRLSRQQAAQAQTRPDATWYFYNPTAVSQGKQQFQRLWGKRDNTDNWQRANQTVMLADDGTSPEGSSDDDTDLTATGGDDAPTAPDGTPQPNAPAAGAEPADTAQLDPHTREYYLAQIPFTEEQQAESHAAISEALLQSGIIFKDKLDNLPLSRKQLLRLAEQYPNFEGRDLMWYHLFLLYSRLGDTAQADHCLQQLKEHHPESEWTTLLNDPYYAENALLGEHIEDSLYAATYEAFRADRHAEIRANVGLSASRFPLGQHRPKFLFIGGLSMLNSGDADSCVNMLKEVVEKYPQSEVSEMAGMIVRGVQEGRPLYGGKFDLGSIWSRRDAVMATDSAATDTLSADRDVPFVFLLAYEPDSLNENQLLYELARHNFTNFVVRNFAIEISAEGAVHLMQVGGFLNYDEALQYARLLYASPTPIDMLRKCRNVIVSQQNLALLGTRYSFEDYQEFYDRVFLPLMVTPEPLLNTPENQDFPDFDDIFQDPPSDDQQPVGQPAGGGGFDFDEDFW